MPIQGPGPSQLSMTNNSMSIPSNNHGSMGAYNHSVPSSQSIPGQSQMTISQGQPMANYGPRPNINMAPNQGKEIDCWLSTKSRIITRGNALTLLNY